MQRINAFDDFLNEIVQEISILGMTFEPASVLFEVDPIAYNEEWLSFLNNFMEANSIESSYYENIVALFEDGESEADVLEWVSTEENKDDEVEEEN